jgi:hypothetical protein
MSILLSTTRPIESGIVGAAVAFRLWRSDPEIVLSEIDCGPLCKVARHVSDPSLVPTCWSISDVGMFITESGEAGADKMAGRSRRLKPRSKRPSYLRAVTPVAQAPNAHWRLYFAAAMI